MYFIYHFRVGVTPAFRANQFNGAVANVPTTSTSSAASNSTRAHSRNESFGNEVSSERGIETHGKFMRTFTTGCNKKKDPLPDYFSLFYTFFSLFFDNSTTTIYSQLTQRNIILICSVKDFKNVMEKSSKRRSIFLLHPVHYMRYLTQESGYKLFGDQF